MRRLLFGIAIVGLLTGVLTVSAAAAAPTFPTMNDAGGIYWRSAPDWNKPVAVPGNGFYPGTYVTVQCYQSGTTVPGSANTMWVEASWASGPGSGSGWMNEHFVNDGAPINQAAPGVPPCSAPPPPWNPAPAYCATGCALQSKANGLYVSAEISRTGDGYGTLRARASAIGSWEQYTVVGDCSTSAGCALQSKANGLYVSAEISRTGDGYGTLRARASAIGSWERYNISGDCTSGTGCALRSQANGLYVSAELGFTGDNYGTLRARASAIGSWERFGAVPLDPAITWAIAHNNQIYGTAAEQPAESHQWSGFCWTFVFDAFGGRVPRELTAQDGYNYYAGQGRIHSGPPPAGSIAFYSDGTTGHAAVGVGGGDIIGTHGSDTDRLPTYEVAYNNRLLPYLGWATP
jgi:hypothetical protein